MRGYTKVCKTCHKDKPASEYYKKAGNKDGLYTECKACHKKRVAEWQQTPDGIKSQMKYNNSDKSKEWKKQYSQKPRVRKKATKAVARWRKNNPEAYLAHNAVQQALYHGKIEKKPCEVCGDEHSEAHHPDYSKPMRVRWLCKEHHEAIHHN